MAAGFLAASVDCGLLHDSGLDAGFLVENVYCWFLCSGFLGGKAVEATFLAAGFLAANLDGCWFLGL